MNRRDFLLLRTGPPVTLSCERLYMRYLDAELEGSTARLFANLEHELRSVTEVQLTDTTWLSRDDLQQRLDGVLDGFRARGGRWEVRR